MEKSYYEGCTVRDYYWSKYYSSFFNIVFLIRNYIVYLLNPNHQFNFNKIIIV